MKNVLVTGSGGGIGSVLFAGLQNVRLTPYDLPEHDLRNFDQLAHACERKDAVVHLAWDMQAENSRAPRCHPDNFMNTQRMYEAAVLAGVRRLIFASSVHADTFKFKGRRPLLRTDSPATPDSPYGANKGFGELLGRYHASVSGLEVICIRFGSVCAPGASPRPDEELTWLSDDDCVSLAQACLDTPQVPGGFEIINGVSLNKGMRVHSLDNTVGWMPKDSWPPMQ